MVTQAYERYPKSERIATESTTAVSSAYLDLLVTIVVAVPG